MSKAREGQQTVDPMKSLSKKYANLSETKKDKCILKYGITDAKYYYLKQNKCSKEQSELYKEVVETYFEEISKAIIQKNYSYLWYRVGEFHIAKFNGSPIIYSHKSAILKKVVSYINLHTSGWVYMFYWSKKRCVFYNRDYYHFQPCEGKPEICGKAGLKMWIKKLHENSHMTDYNAFVRNSSMEWKRRKKREALKEDHAKKEAEKLKLLL